MLLNKWGVCVPAPRVPLSSRLSEATEDTIEEGLDPSVEGDFLKMILGWNITLVCALPHIPPKWGEVGSHLIDLLIW